MADPATETAPTAVESAQEVADRLEAEHAQAAFPVSTGAEHAEQNQDAPVDESEINHSNNNKRKYEDNPGDEVVGNDEGPMKKRASFSAPEGASNGDAEENTEEPTTENPTTGFSSLPPPAAGSEDPAGGLAGGQPGGQHTDFVEIPSVMVGKLIGKQGETIKALQYSTNTKVQIDHTTPGEVKKVSVTGPNVESVEEAKRQIQQIITAESVGEVHRSVDCPPGIVGRVIGRGGETIRSLQQASQANIVVDQNFPEGVPRKVNISGKPEPVERAVKMVTELINGEPGSAQAVIQKYGAGVTRTLDCPKSMVGRVIGKGGETIKSLQKTFGANIQIDQSTDPMKVTITGPPNSVGQAEAAVAEIIAGGNPFGSGMLASGLGSYGAAGRGAASPGYGAYGGGYGAYGGGYGGFTAPSANPAAGYGYGYGAYPQAYPTAGGYGAYGSYGAGGAADYSSAGSYGGGYGQAGAGSAGAAASGGGSSVWQEVLDSEGRPYYYNNQTGVSQWEKPAEMQ